MSRTYTLHGASSEGHAAHTSSTSTSAIGSSHMYAQSTGWRGDRQHHGEGADLEAEVHQRGADARQRQHRPREADLADEVARSP